MPAIRHSRYQSVASSIASILQDKMDVYVRQTGFLSEREQATLLVLDRSQDVLAPLLHEFYYQGMANELLDIREERYSYESEDRSGKTEKKDVLLNETDDIWSSVRHMHIAEALEHIPQEFKRFTETSKAAKIAQGEGGGKIEDMTAAVKEMPAFKEKTARYSLHINISKELMRKFNQEGLSDFAMLEQDMAMGEDSEGNKIGNKLPDVIEFVRSHDRATIDKVRLIMIYMVTQKNLSEADRVKLLEVANIGAVHQAAMQNLRHIADDGGAPPEEKKKKKKSLEDESYEVSRREPKLKEIAGDLLNGALSDTEYPYVKPPVDSGGGGAAKSSGTSHRKQGNPRWAQGGGRRKAAAEEMKGPVFKGPRLIIFIAGGMTFSEMRMAYKLTKETQREVIIGSTSTTMCGDFVTNLAGLSEQ